MQAPKLAILATAATCQTCAELFGESRALLDKRVAAFVEEGFVCLHVEYLDASASRLLFVTVLAAPKPNSGGDAERALLEAEIREGAIALAKGITPRASHELSAYAPAFPAWIVTSSAELFRATARADPPALLLAQPNTSLYAINCARETVFVGFGVLGEPRYACGGENARDAAALICEDLNPHCAGETVSPRRRFVAR